MAEPYRPSNGTEGADFQDYFCDRCERDRAFRETDYQGDPALGCMPNGIGYPADAEPYIKWKHIDGPLLVCRNGALHWLTWRDRIRWKLGLEDIYSLERKYLY